MKKVKVIWEDLEANLPYIIEVPDIAECLIQDWIEDTYGYKVKSFKDETV